MTQFNPFTRLRSPITLASSSTPSIGYHLDQSQQTTLQSQAQADPNQAAFLERNRELTEIAKSIGQLAELFKDLGALVIDQGTLLDSVEYNIEQTAVEMQSAVKELDTATRWVSSSSFLIFLLLWPAVSFCL